MSEWEWGKKVRSSAIAVNDIRAYHINVRLFYLRKPHLLLNLIKVYPIGNDMSPCACMRAWVRMLTKHNIVYTASLNDIRPFLPELMATAATVPAGIHSTSRPLVNCVCNGLAWI